ncbi:hypothetical protein [Burkholderia ubonensis]|uniref:hypothetical protein n=1 Tax=Burkholderia ubonensis TaxID=101571 RepID=UPI0007567472|nr:hypothetical protein [Burkholderia ubonensis]KVT95590.1 hypothetical protein WK61_15480 [Burkholderia ubonensis]
MKRQSKASIARENVSRLASIGLASMEVETLRAAREAALRDLRKARREWRGRGVDGTDIDEHECVRGPRADYDRLASGHKNASARFQREVKRYREWLAEVSA